MGHDLPNLHTLAQRPLAHQKVLLSFRVIAYYGLIRDSDKPWSKNHCFSPEETAQGGPSEVPQFTPQDCLPVPSSLPRRSHECIWLLLPHGLWPSPSYERLGIRIRRFEAAKFALCYGPDTC